MKESELANVRLALGEARSFVHGCWAGHEIGPEVVELLTKLERGIGATLSKGALAQCGACGRYTTDPFAGITLDIEPPPLLKERSRCDCGEADAWSSNGDFPRPAPDAQWSVGKHRIRSAA
jgi:hypothetical protein